MSGTKELKLTIQNVIDLLGKSRGSTSKDRLREYLGEKILSIKVSDEETFDEYIGRIQRLSINFDSYRLGILFDKWEPEYSYEVISNIKKIHEESEYLTNVVLQLYDLIENQNCKKHIEKLVKIHEKIFVIVLYSLNNKEYDQKPSQVVRSYIDMQYPSSEEEKASSLVDAAVDSAGLNNCLIETTAYDECEGNLGNGFIWKFTDGNKLFITGSGYLKCGHWYKPIHNNMHDNERDEELYFPINKYVIEHTENLYLAEGITAIGDDAFNGFAHLKNVFLPDTIQEIGQCAFADCVSLITINIPDKVEKIGYSAFINCIRLRKIYLSDNITISGCAFLNCISLQVVEYSGRNSSEVKDKKTIVEHGAFASCYSLKKVYLRNVMLIESGAFNDCSDIELYFAFLPNATIENEAFENIDNGELTFSPLLNRISTHTLLGEVIRDLGEIIWYSIKKNWKLEINDGAFVKYKGKVIFNYCYPLICGKSRFKFRYYKDYKYKDITLVLPYNISKSLKKKMKSMFDGATVEFKDQSW